MCFFCSKVDPEVLPRIVAILPALLADDSVAVIKKLTLCLSSVYKTALQVDCRVKLHTRNITWWQHLCILRCYTYIQIVLFRVLAGQEKLEKVREFLCSGKVREKSGKDIIFEKSGTMILDRANCRYLWLFVSSNINGLWIPKLTYTFYPFCWKCRIFW